MVVFKFMEVWKSIKDYDGLYEVSNLGNVKTIEKIVLKRGKYPSLSKEKLLSQPKCKNGYLRVTLIKDKKPKTFLSHQLVAIAFLNHKIDKHKIVVNHLNFKRDDNRVENLELITSRANASYKQKIGTSLYTGVYFRKDANKWSSQININGKIKSLGLHKNEYDAHLAYQNELKNL